MAQVVACVVLLQLAQIVEDAAIGEHDLEPEHQFARDSISERAGAASIGREIAADGAAAFRAERERKQAAGGGCGLLRPDENHARFTGHGVGGRIDLADAVEAPQREQDLALVWRLAADKAGIAALRHDRGFGLVRKPESRCDLLDAAWPQYQL